MGSFCSLSFVLVLLAAVAETNMVQVTSQEQFRANYADALTKSLLFFEGQRSGKLPRTQRMKWRKDSALTDGQDVGMKLDGGYYDAGDHVKYNFPMSFTVTVLSWGVIEYGNLMGKELAYNLQAIRWATDYLLKCTSSLPDKIFFQIGNPHKDQACWERPEDMDTDRTTYFLDKDHPGSEVSAEMAAALASASIVFKDINPTYSAGLLQRATGAFEFADKYRGNYNDSFGDIVCPYYCDWGGYPDELIWAASWLYKATNNQAYWDYIMKNFGTLNEWVAGFGWDSKHSGIALLIANDLLRSKSVPAGADVFRQRADRFVCTVLPESPTNGLRYTPGGLMYREGACNLQMVTAVSFLLITYSRYLSQANQAVQCGDKVITPDRMIALAKDQVDYILGKNPSQMSYMVGYGNKFPQRIHHRGSSLPSIDQHPAKIACGDGTPYFNSEGPNPNVLTGALVGGPDQNDYFNDSRPIWPHSEPTTYMNAPIVAVLAYLTANVK